MSISLHEAIQIDIDAMLSGLAASAPSDSHGIALLTRDVGELVSIALQQFRRRVNVQELDDKAATDSEIDLSLIKQAVDLLSQAPGTSSYTWPGAPSVSITLRDELNTMRQKISDFDDAQREHGPLEAQLRLSFSFDMIFSRILVCDIPDETRDKLEELVLRSIVGIPEDQMIGLWSGVLHDFSEDRILAPFPKSAAALPYGFLEPSGVEEVRHHYARYIVRVNPELSREVYATGKTTTPSGSRGLGSILARKTVVLFSPAERRILTLLMRLYEAWGRENDGDYRRSLGLSENAWVTRAGRFAGLGKPQAFSITKTGDPARHVTALQLARRILTYGNASLGSSTEIEQALWNYKLGLEVSFQPKHRRAELFNETEGLSEIYLQRHACRYLTDRNIAAFGVNFGSSQIDLLARHDHDLIAIEAKIFKNDTDWRNIDQHLAQLQRYMDQQRLTPRGVLLIYNRSKVALESAVRWIRSRYWILVVNLCPATPSGTKHSVLIEEGDGQQLKLTPNFLRKKTASKKTASKKKAPAKKKASAKKASAKKENGS